MLIIYRIVLPLIGVCCMLSCEGSGERKSKKLAATFDGGEIGLDEVDRAIEDQLYEQLYGIYQFRNIALREIIDVKVFDLEAKRVGLTTKDLLEENVDKKLSEDGLNKFVLEYEFDKYFVDPENPFKPIDIKTEEGKEKVWKEYRKKEVEKYSLFLQKKYEFEKVIQPPIPPRIQMEHILYQKKRGSEKSDLQIWILFDFDCNVCKKLYYLFEKLHNKLSDQAEFRYVGVSPSGELPFVACECAAQQNLFQETYNYSFTAAPIDSMGYVNLIKESGGDVARFVNCLSNEKIKNQIMESGERLINIGITRTPSILVNGRIYYGQFTEDKIIDYIEVVKENF